ncbi:hypothetical protein [Bacillus sp. EB01]|nr:hypothetical protein [Bacillus sp. EB01]
MLEDEGINPNIITTISWYDQTAYYFDQSVDFIILQRSDQTFILDR